MAKETNMKLWILKTLYWLCNFGTAASCGEEITAPTCLLLTLYRTVNTTEDEVEAVKLLCNLAKEFCIAVPSAPFFFCFFQERTSVLLWDEVLLWDDEWLTLLQIFCNTLILNVAFVRCLEPHFASRMPGRTQSPSFVLDNECWIF